MKKIIKRIFHDLGYRIERINVPTDPDSRVAATLPASECYAKFVSSGPIFQPWLGHGDFVAAYEGVKEKTLVSPDRCYLLWKLAQHARQLRGDFIECGVYRGGTALLLARTLPSEGKTLWLFDSFEGLPKESAAQGDFYKQGTFNETSLKEVSQLLLPYAKRLEVRKGWIPSTFAGLDHLQFSFAHVDVDLHDPALACCEFIYPRLVPGGAMVFDDYGYPACRGEREAVDKFFAGKPEPVISLPSGQALVLKM